MKPTSAKPQIETKTTAQGEKKKPLRNESSSNAGAREREIDIDLTISSSQAKELADSVGGVCASSQNGNAGSS